MLNIMYNNVIG